MTGRRGHTISEDRVGALNFWLEDMNGGGKEEWMRAELLPFLLETASTGPRLRTYRSTFVQVAQVVSVNRIVNATFKYEHAQPKATTLQHLGSFLSKA
jgi:hypothetical protein